MGHLTISDLLRNALPGSVFLIVIALGYPDVLPRISLARAHQTRGSEVTDA